MTKWIRVSWRKGNKNGVHRFQANFITLAKVRRSDTDKMYRFSINYGVGFQEIDRYKFVKLRDAKQAVESWFHIKGH